MKRPVQRWTKAERERHLLGILAEECAEVAIRAFAKELGISESMLHLIYRKKRSPNERILKALGVERTVVYRRKR